MFLELLEPAITSQSEPFALLFLDLNRFKTVNDSLGHSVGDRLIRDVGERLTTLTAERGVVGRFSGDEFAIVMRDCYAHEATRVAATILERLAGLVVPANTGSNSVTASLGIACSAPAHESPAQVLAAADHASYVAKHSGRKAGRP